MVDLDDDGEDEVHSSVDREDERFQVAAARSHARYDGLSSLRVATMATFVVRSRSLKRSLVGPIPLNHAA